MGAVQNGPKKASQKFDPQAFDRFIFDTDQGYYFDIDRFIEQVNALNIPASERTAIIRASLKGDIVYEIFIGGGSRSELVSPKLLNLQNIGLRIENTRMGLAIVTD